MKPDYAPAWKLLLSFMPDPAEQAPPLCDALYDAEQLPEEEPTEMDRAGIDPLTPVDTFIEMNSTTRYIGEIA